MRKVNRAAVCPHNDPRVPGPCLNLNFLVLLQACKPLKLLASPGESQIKKRLTGPACNDGKQPGRAPVSLIYNDAYIYGQPNDGTRLKI